jgi:hypothetical protein
MPWFVTSICSDEVLENIRHEIIDPEYSRPQRTFGFFDSYADAVLAIKNNFENMQECLYDWIVLEYIESGIHPKVHKTEWYKWVNYRHFPPQWVARGNKCPKEFKGLVNFALG